MIRDIDVYGAPIFMLAGSELTADHQMSTTQEAF